MSETNITSESPKEHTTKSAEREILEKLAFESIKEQRKTRIWGMVFKAFIAVYLLIVLVMAVVSSPTSIPSGEFTALIELKGGIMADGPVNADKVFTALRKALEESGTKAVILRANSPGGSPVQAGYIYDEIMRLKEKYKKPIYTVITDACASACYYIASASDKIYADKASIVGSIGVRIDSFGFVKTLKLVGAERRLFTAGENKGFLDPFSPLSEKAVKHTHELLNQVHRQFIDAVKKGRKDKLREFDGMFSGLFWTGEKAKELGLVDELASSSTVAREVVKAEKLVDFTQKDSLFERFARGLGNSAARSVMSEFEFPAPRLH